MDESCNHLKEAGIRRFLPLNFFYEGHAVGLDEPPHGPSRRLESNNLWLKRKTKKPTNIKCV